MSSNMSWVYNDGGRKAAGLGKISADCACRAIALATEIPYITVYNQISKLITTTMRPRSIARSASYCPPSLENGGIPTYVSDKYLKSLNWKRVDRRCRLSNIPNGRLIVQMPGHLVTVIDRVFYDVWDSSSDGDIRIYGYWVERISNG